jgi:hypothetical protein
MGGVLLIRDEPARALWLPQSSTYDVLLECAANELAEADPELAQRLLAARLESHGGYAALDDLDTHRFARFLAAVRHALGNARGKGSVPSLAELVALLRTDPRAGEPDTTGTLVIDDDRRWTAPRWLFDFVVAHLDLSPDADTLDVRRGAADLLPHAVWMQQRYGDAEGRSAHAPAVHARIAEGVNALHAALRDAAAGSDRP